MKRLVDNLKNKEGNHVLPFFWQHGEDEAILRKYMEKIYDSNIRSVCIEARPHKDFLGEKWWNDLEIILDEAKKRNMNVWLLDDSHFPTGFCNGEIRDHYPQYKKRYLAVKQLDFCGPVKYAQIIISNAYQEKEDKLVGVYLAKKIGYNEIDPETITEITDQVIGITSPVIETDDETVKRYIVRSPREQVVNVNLPEGEWKIIILTETYAGGEKETENYLNPIDPDATEILLKTVYETHYEHYKEEFGKTIKGFFSDEPRFGNCHGPFASIGRWDMELPWRTDLISVLQSFVEKKDVHIDVKKYLPLLFVDGGVIAHQMRYFYMDLVSELYAENFSGKIGKWCEEHNVKYIGHVIEDNNSHARLGNGAGHFFRSMKGQHFAGIDVVLHQLMPGMDKGLNRAMTSKGWDGEFFHYVLGKLGSSLAHLDPKKEGNAMCEVFGAYGWAEGNRLMKWIIDYMLVRGINEFVPHAFSPMKYPDPDCPPHFYANGMNPQFKDFGLLMKYTNRIAHLFHGGKPIAHVALGYHGEAEWAGDYMLMQKPAAVMAKNQIEYGIVPADSLNDAVIKDSTFDINGLVYQVIVIPYSEALPKQYVENLVKLATEGVKVYFVDGFPVRSAEGLDIQNVLTVLKEKCKVVKLEQLKDTLMEFSDFVVSKEQPYLRYYQYKGENDKVFFITNEGTTSIICDVKTNLPEQFYVYDAFDNTLSKEKLVDGQLHLELEPYESKTIICAQEDLTEYCVDVRKKGKVKKVELADFYKVSFSSANETEFHDEIILNELKPIQQLEGKQNFSGTIRYETEFQVNEQKATWITLDTIYEGASVSVNGKKPQTKICPPYSFDVTDDIQVGENRVVIDVTTTPVRENYDFLSQFVAIEPIGITEHIYLEMED